jgi:hypothetical protein
LKSHELVMEVQTVVVAAIWSSQQVEVTAMWANA